MSYTPRRCGKRWLDADCPREVLAIIDYGHHSGARYDVVYADVSTVVYPDRPNSPEYWLQGFSIGERGNGHDHFEMYAHQVAAYRYRFKHKYTKWSTLPEAVKRAVRADIAAAKEWEEQNA